jgi:Ca-activated chloride channel family protein
VLAGSELKDLEPLFEQIKDETGLELEMQYVGTLNGAEKLMAGEEVDSEFFKGQALTSGSSGWLAESYVREQDRLDGIVNYESVLLALNKSGQLREKLYLVYPKEGIITADYPLMLINQDRREDYDKLVAYLRSPEFQQDLMTQTLRRPAISEVRPNAEFPDQLLIELPFPNSLEVIDALLFAYLDEQSVPSHAIFVLDVSGSMEGEGLNQLKAGPEQPDRRGHQSHGPVCPF